MCRTWVRPIPLQTNKRKMECDLVGYNSWPLILSFSSSLLLFFHVRNCNHSLTLTWLLLQWPLPSARGWWPLACQSRATTLVTPLLVAAESTADSIFSLLLIECLVLVNFENHFINYCYLYYIVFFFSLWCIFCEFILLVSFIHLVFYSFNGLVLIH